MEKVVKFLELHVQWFALAFAVLYVGWVAYVDLANEPLETNVANRVVGPGEVDPAIKQSQVDWLSSAMEDKKVDPPKVADVQVQYLAALDEKTVKVTDFYAPTTASHITPDGLQNTHIANNPDDKGKFDRLPLLPPATPDAMSVRWTVILVPPAGAAPAPAQPGAPAPAAPAPTRKEIAYYSGTFKLDNAILNQEFSKCFGNAGALNALTAQFVRVTLLREEKSAAGVWSAPQVIRTLSIHDLMKYPGDIKPLPAGKQLKEAYYNYRSWLEKSQELIARPPFYDTAKDAEPWLPPGQAPAVVPGPAGVPAPAPAPGLGPQPVAPGRPLDPRTDPRFRGRFGLPGAPTPPGQFPGRPPAVVPGPGGVPVPPPDAPQNPAFQPGFVNPNGGFNPGLAPDTQILVHDDSIQEGHIYRYAVRYSLLNPMFDKNTLATPNVTEKFEIVSDPTDPKTYPTVTPPIVPEKLWSPEVVVEPRVHIFVQKIEANPNRELADFVIYAWRDGHWVKTVTKRSPGDPIAAGKELTPWTVVDVRKELHGNQAYALVVDDKGVMTRRDTDSDQADLQKFEIKIGAAAAPAAAAAR